MRIPSRAMVVLICLALLASVSLAERQAGDIAVVVSEKNPVSSLSSQEVKDIFAGNMRTWPTGVPIKLFVRAPGTRERIVLLQALGMTEDDYKRLWIGKVFRGEADKGPITVFSNDMQREALQVYPGAVALISADDLGPGIKVLKVDGRLPGNNKYPLR